MDLMALDRDDLPIFFERLAERYDIAAPARKDTGYAFRDVRAFSEVELGYTSTMLPPKKYLHPPKETLFTYRLNGALCARPEPDTRKRAIFWAHACDINGLWLVGDIFAEGLPDTEYLRRRGNTVVIGADCKSPCSENSFCMDIGTHIPGGGFDLYFTDLGELYAVQVGSSHGRALLGMAAFFPAGYFVRERFIARNRQKSGLVGKTDGRLGFDVKQLPGMLGEAYESFIWEALEERCFDCGACTVVCPTCYCFDVRDEPGLDQMSGKRIRSWDGCQIRNFAEVAGGENFRKRRADRIRHRVFRKGKYIKEQYGRFACVGCGRCGRVCLARIDIGDIFRQLRG